MLKSWILYFGILCGILFPFLIDAAVTVPGVETQVVNHILQNYNKHIRPAYNPAVPTEVSLQFQLGRIESLEEKSQVLTSFGWIIMIWTDDFLQWDPADFMGVYRIVISGDQIWLPEIALLNSVDEMTDLGFDTRFRAQVYADGTVVYSPGFKWKTSCQIQLDYFPFDKQTCYLRFINWVYTASGVTFEVKNKKVLIDVLEESGEWEVAEATVKGDILQLEAHGDVKFPQVEVHIDMKRNPRYFVFQVIIPSMIMTAVSALVFLLPAEAGEKVSLGITVLLAYSVVLLIVSDITPRNGFALPILGYFITGSMALTALSLILTVGVLNLYHHSPHTPVPLWLKAMVINGLGLMLCMSTNGHQSHAVVPVRQPATLKDADEDPNDPTCVPDIHPELLEFARAMNARESREDFLETNKSEWMLTSKILDRTLFFLFTISVVGLSAYLMVSLAINKA